MPTVGEIVATLAERTRPQDAAVWDPVGLQLGDPDAPVESVGVCHEVTEELVSQLESNPVDLLVTYHPLLFEPVNRLLAGRSASARAFRLLRVGANLLVTHTDFDAAPGGTADALARILKLRDIETFGANEEQRIPAIGRVGEFQGTLATVDAIVSDVLRQSGIRVSGDRKMKVDLVAVVPGSGSDFIAQAAELADVLVTGDVGHHNAVRALDLGLAIVDPGHIATERPGMEALVSLVGDAVSVPLHDYTNINPQTW
jgi:dinuclear metal center YbgI/SA1388 family protein